MPNPNQDVRRWLYREDCPAGKIFAGIEAIEEARSKGWENRPVPGVEPVDVDEAKAAAEEEIEALRAAATAELEARERQLDEREALLDEREKENAAYEQELSAREEHLAELKSHAEAEARLARIRRGEEASPHQLGEPVALTPKRTKPSKKSKGAAS